MTSWIFDSGCSFHMTNDVSLLTTRDTNCEFPLIQTANGEHIKFTHRGHITPHTDPTKRLTLGPVLVSLSLCINLISISALASIGLDVLFSLSSCVVQDRQTGQVRGTGRRIGSLYYLESLHVPSTTGVFTASVSVPSLSASLWHRRLGHVSYSRLN